MVDLQQVLYYCYCALCNFRERLGRVEKKAANMLNLRTFRLSSTTAALLNGIILGMLIFLDNDKIIIHCREEGCIGNPPALSGLWVQIASGGIFSNSSRLEAVYCHYFF